MSSHFTWSILSPLSLSHSCVDSKAACTIKVVSSLEWAIAEIDPSLTYSVWGARAAQFIQMLFRICGRFVSLVMVPEWMALLSGAVKYTARIGEVHGPWGTPVFMGERGSCFSSSLIVAILFWRNE